MKISKSECVKIITTIKAQNPESLQYKNSSEFELLVDVWFDVLKEYPKELVWAAVRNALKKTIYQKPNWIGVICQEIECLRTTNEKTDGELWGELISALNKVNRVMYFGLTPHWDNNKRIEPIEEVGKVYNKLDPILRSYVGGISELIALSKEETLEYEKGRFLKAVIQLRQKEKTKKEMPADLAKLVNGIADTTVIKTAERGILQGR